MATKRCPSCGVEKDHNEFGRRSGARSGQLRGQCQQCEREKRKAYYYKDVDLSRASTRDYYRDNREARRESSRRWRVKNPDKVKAQNDKESTRQASREWTRRNPDRVRENTRRGQRRRRVDRDEEAVWYMENVLEHDPCCYCGGPCEEIDHIDPLIEGGENKWWNLTASCRRCNRSKHARRLLLWMLNGL